MVRLDHRFHDRHAQSGAALLPGARGIGRVEPFEDARPRFGGHARSVVAEAHDGVPHAHVYGLADFDGVQEMPQRLLRSRHAAERIAADGGDDLPHRHLHRRIGRGVPVDVADDVRHDLTQARCIPMQGDRGQILELEHQTRRFVPLTRHESHRAAGDAAFRIQRVQVIGGVLDDCGQVHLLRDIDATAFIQPGQ